ncbi:MAG: UV DNA damage repair endonuclease UvsE [Clostridia bacterium]|nr:MAG: UV DNA damage repair endonuclease UvsE [Clostridia bacterium]
MRLGFSVSVLGRTGLHSHDSRRWQNAPHLSVSLAYLRDVLLYLDTQNIRMYRLASDLAPYLTHPDLPQFHHQIEESRPQLQAVGELARRLDIRLSFHAPAYVLLNTPDPVHLRQSIAELQGMAAIFDAMSLGTEAVIILHVGGHYHDRAGALDAFVQAFDHLPATVQQHIALEHDDRRFSVQDVLWIHQRTGVRLVFDHLHHQLYNPDAIPAPEALAICFATWPPDQTPKIHFSTPATEMVRDRKGAPHPPRLNRHSHYINPFQFIDFLDALPTIRDFDVMIEAKARDLALLQLRRHLGRYAPALIRRFNII